MEKQTMRKFNPAFICVAVLIAAAMIVAMRPTLAVQLLSIVTCGTTTACTGGNNTSGGPGVQGTSALGTGVVGQAKFNSTSSSNGQPGVLGQDLSTSGHFDTGVKGTSVHGFGVLGTSSSNTGVRGTSGSSSGVVGTSTSTAGSGTGVQGMASGFGPGVVGTSANGVGISGTATHSEAVVGNGNIGVAGEDISGVNTPSTRDDVFANGFGGRLFRGNNSSGVDVFTVSDSGITNVFALTGGSSSVGTGVNANGAFAGVQGSAATSTAFGVQGNNTSGATSVAIRANGFGGPLFVGNNSFGNDVFTVDDGGNVHAHSFTADLAVATGARVVTYALQASQPTIEDVGEATLIAGQAYVRIDAAFAATMARDTTYLVFLTPQGPTQGSLYVTQKSPAGFAVRENYTGRSTVAFDYRIVARPYGVRAQRLPAAPQLTRHALKVMVKPPMFHHEVKRIL
jgi:hypothetical protein